MKSSVQIEDAMVFRKDFNGHPVYSLGIGGKKYEDGHETGSYVNGYMNVQFSRGNAPSDKQHINITRSFLTAYEGSDGKGKIKLVVMEWQPYQENVPY